MTTGDFDTYYSDEPFSLFTENQRTWLDPDLIDIWRQKSVFRPLISFTKNLGSIRATSMTVTELFDPHPDTTALSNKQIWMPSMYIDSRAVEITFQRNGNKMAYHKYDDMITYWRKNNQAGLRAIVRGALGQSEVDMNDLLARNALIAGAAGTGYTLYSGDATDFGDIATGDVFDPYLGAEIQLGMINRGVPGAMGPSGAGGSVVCYTSPGVIYDIQKNENWMSVNEYLKQDILLNYEAGSFKGVRYVQTPKCTLWNCGEVIVRAPIVASCGAGDGAPDPSTTKVDGTYLVGQKAGGITHYLQLDDATSGSLGGLLVNDIITIHKTVTSDYGVTNGVDFEEGTAMNRRIVAINTDTKRITLDQPILVDYTTDLGGGVYGYVTKARNVHASIFVGGPQAIVAGVAQPPQFYELDPIDDFKAIYRFSYDQYMGYQPFRPEVFEVCFSAGTTRIKGRAAVQ
jgi:N4-gp56 family major capsid protein